MRFALFEGSVMPVRRLVGVPQHQLDEKNVNITKKCIFGYC